MLHNFLALLVNCLLLFIVLPFDCSSSLSSNSASTNSNKPPKPKWLHCVNCKSPFGNAWDLMVHVQTAHMLNIYQLADTTKLQNVSTIFF